MVPQGFLKGVRVLDLGQYLPGPMATRILADLGAGVVKIEPPGGDPLRHMNPLSGLQEAGAGLRYYNSVNAGKSVVRLDLKSPAGKASFEKLIGLADVLLESYRPGVLSRLGFDRPRLEHLNPGLIHCALTGYGQSGPRAQDAGHDIGYAALTGGLAFSGGTDRPAFNWPPVVDHASAQQAAISILGALADRSTGEGGRRGCFIDMAISDCYLAWQDWGLTAASSGEAADNPGLSGNLLNGGAACYRLYGTSDGRFIALGALEKKFWRNFCAAVGKPQWAERQQEPLPQTGLVGEVAALIAGGSLSHWTDVLGGVDCCFQAVLEYGETIDDEQVRERRLLQSGAGFVQVLYPAHIDGNPPRERPPVRETNFDQIIGSWE